MFSLSIALDGGRAAAQPEPAVSASLDEEARGLFEAGKAAYEDGRFETALEYFERAYALSQRPALQYNLGLAYDRLRRDADALRAFEAYLELSLGADPQREQEVANRVRALREHLTKVAQEEQAKTTEPEPVAPLAPPPEEAPKVEGRSRKRWIWAAVGAGVVVIGAGIIATWAASRDDEKPRQPNSGVTIEALTWR